MFHSFVSNEDGYIIVGKMKILVNWRVLDAYKKR